tara:strand:- start:1438 stop:2616 length:1179 start_codon:yes stop_codon:yes gene_type:complete
MLKNIKKGMFPFLIAFSALSVSASAAFYSVYGLSKLFAGAQFQVIIMAGSLEFAKLVTASLLYQYWGTINKTLRTYLTVATVILVIITSMGIYGFLSAAYQDTYNKLTINENQISFLNQKKEFYENDVIRYDKELERISNNISTLSNAKSRTIQVRDTSVAGGIRTTISTSELRLAQNRINVEEENRKNVQAKRETVADSLQKYQLAILDLKSNNEISGELGPLQYLSGLTGYPMDKIINVLLLIIIFVFDPLAISLVVAANFAFDVAYPRKKYRENLYEEKVEVPIEPEFVEGEKHHVFDEYTDDDEKRMDIIGQNGNEGDHYEAPVVETLLADVKAIEKEEVKEKKKKIIKDLLEDKGGWNGNVPVTPERVEEAYNKLTEDDDLTINYTK